MQAAIKSLLPVVLLATVACKDITDALPPGTVDPETFRTPAGAVSLYRGALRLMSQAMRTVINMNSSLSDEVVDSDEASLAALQQFAGSSPPKRWARNPSESDNRSLFMELSILRHNADYTANMLGVFPDEVDQNIRGAALAFKGFAIVLLGEMFCSGIPLSTVNFDGDFTFSEGLSTSDVFSVALRVFDSAAALAKDSAQILALANVGAARALLNLERYEEARARVSQIPTDFLYRLPDVKFSNGNGAIRPMIANRKGGNGLPYASRRDARIKPLFSGGLNQLGDSVFYSLRYSEPDADWYPIASGIEARLIEAEALLRNRDPVWIAKLDSLRTDGSYTIPPSGDTVWGKGTGGVAGLGPLSDLELPVDPSVSQFDREVNVFFKERAFWLYLQGHRLGDMRRLVRQYERETESVFPTGFIGGAAGIALNIRFGEAVSFRVPPDEMGLNSRYRGCLHLGA